METVEANIITPVSILSVAQTIENHAVRFGYSPLSNKELNQDLEMSDEEQEAMKVHALLTANAVRENDTILVGYEFFPVGISDDDYTLVAIGQNGATKTHIYRRTRTNGAAKDIATWTIKHTTGKSPIITKFDGEKTKTLTEPDELKDLDQTLKQVNYILERN